MDYNNFLLRSFFSAFFIIIYFFCVYLNFQYVFYLILLVYILIFMEIYIYFNKYKLFAIIYTFISFIFFYSLDFGINNIIVFNLFILIVVSFDISSYIIGKTLGKNKLIKISPNKTYEGLVGGLIMSFILSLFFSYYFKININFNLILFIFIIIFSAFSGDIIESFYKRKNNLKNSSEFIPGHGGVFDRFDSFLFSIIFYSIFSNILIWILIFTVVPDT